MGLCIDISNEIKVATIKIYEETILKIKAANALQFQSSLTTLVVQWRQRNLPKNVLHFQSCPASRDFFPGCLLAYTCSKSFASPKAMPGRTFARRVVQSFSFAFFFSFPSSLSESQRGGPWSPEISAVEPGALSFYWLEPWSFFGCGAWSLKTFCAEPGAEHFQVWSFELPDCIDSWLLPFCVCLCVLTGIKKQNLKRGQYIIQVYAVISVYNDMQQLI